MIDHMAGTRIATPAKGALTGSLPQVGKLPTPVAIYLVMLMLPVTFHVGSMFMTNLRLVTLVLIVPLTIRLFSGKYGRILWTDILFFLHMAWAGLALAKNNPQLALTQIGSLGPEFLGGYLIGRAYIRDKATFIILCKWLMVLVLLTLPFAIYETQTGWPPIIGILDKLPGLNSLTIVNIDKRMGMERVQAMLTHPIHYGLFASTALSLTLVGLKGVISDTRRWIAGILIAICTFLSLSSGAFLPMVAQFFFIFWAAVFDRTGKPWILLTALAALAYVTVDLLSNRTPILVFFSYATFSSHNAYWRSIIFDWGMKNVWMNPFLGLGLRDWIRPWYMRSGSMDNFWLVMAVRYGIPGFLLIASGYLLALWQIGRRQFGNDRVMNQLRRAWMFTFVGLTFTLCTVHVWTNIYSFVFFAFGAGIWFITATPDTGEETATAAEVDPRRAAPVYARTHVARPQPEPVATVRADEAPSAPREAPRFTRFDNAMRRR